MGVTAPRLLWAAAVLLVLYLLACLLLWGAQRSLIYFPQPSAVDTPLLRLNTPGAEVVASVRAHPGPNALIYFGGNAEDVSRSLARFSQAFPDQALYLLNYRGYGHSSGSPSQAAFEQDARTLFDTVYAEHPHITVIGRSLGSGVAIHLAAERPVASLVLVTPYDSVLALASQQFPWFPIRWLLEDRFESSRSAASIRVPTLLISASDDRVVPADSTARLLQAFAPGIATLKVLPDTQHNSIAEPAQYLQLIRSAL